MIGYGVDCLEALLFFVRSLRAARWVRLVSEGQLH